MKKKKKKRGYVLSYKGLEEKNNGMGEDRAVAKVIACVSPVEQGAVPVLVGKSGGCGRGPGRGPCQQLRQPARSRTEMEMQTGES